MLKKIFLFIFVAVTFGFAQKSKVTAGAMALNNREYDKAIKYLKEALSKPQLLKSKDMAKANAKLFQSYVYYISNAARSKKNPYAAYPNIVNELYTAYQNTKRYDDKGVYTKEIKRMFPMVATLLYMEAFKEYQNKNYDKALDYLNKSDEFFKEQGKDFYANYALRGFIEMEKNDKTKAAKAFEKAVELHKKHLAQLEEKAKSNPNVEVKPDKSIASAYVYLVQIYTDDPANANKVPKLLEEAKKYYPNEQNLNIVEINFYLKNPKLYEEALSKFEEKTRKNPKDKLAWLAYAQLLEKKDEAKAIEAYQKVLALDPENLQANYNIGALYVNKAAETVEVMNNTKDYKEAAKYQDKVKNYFEKAYPYMKKAYELEPDNIGTVQAMMQITTYLNKMDEAAFYRKKKQELKK